MATARTPTPVRAFGIALALPLVVIGVWARITPRGWFEDFPGFGPALAAAEPPYNEHLVTDVAAGFLAIGVLLLGACLLGGPAEMRLAAAGYALFGLPHLVYHAAHPSSLLSTSGNVLNVVLLAAQVAGGILLIVLTNHRKAAAWAS